MRSVNRLSLFGAAVLLACSGAVRADTPTIIYDSGGFEPTRFLDSYINPNDSANPKVTGNLRGQDQGVSKWIQSGSDATGAGYAAVRASVGVSGQGVQMVRTNTDQYWLPSVSITPNVATSRWVQVAWDMKVTQTTTDLNKFGPFFGVVGYNGSQQLGGFGLDATTGELLYFDPTQGIQPVGPTVAFNTWANYLISFDYQTHTYAGYIDGVEQFSGIPFDSGSTQFTDGDLVALQASLAQYSNASGTAYVDNYKVTTFVPEPGAGVAVLGLWTLLGCRRRKAN